MMLNSELPLKEPTGVKGRRMIATIDRELRYRRRVYPRLIAAGKMTLELSDREIAAMEEVLSFLRDYA